MIQSGPIVRPKGIGVEAELLLWIASCADPEERLARIRGLLDRPIDWDYLLHRAGESRVISLLCWHLQRAKPEAVPAEILKKLSADYQRNTMRNLYMTRELIEVLKLLEEKGIQAIPYKGPVIASTVYKSLSLREFWDLDIIVHKGDVLRARDVILTRGYRPEKVMNEKEERQFLETDSEYSLDRDADRMHLEIHWQVLPSPHAHGLDSRDLWDDLVTADLAGHPVKIFSPEKRFVILCIHGGDKHQWSRLKWLADIARMIQVYGAEFDWDRLMKKSAEIGRGPTVDLGLYLSHVLLQAPVPEPIIARIRRDRSIGPFAGLIRGRLFRADRGLPGFEEWLGYMKAEGNANGSLSLFDRSRLFSRYLRALMTPCWDDQQALPLPQWLASLHYVMRPLRMARTHKTGLIRRLR